MSAITPIDGGMYRRSALAIGRVKLAEAISALTEVMQSDRDPEVRQMAAFAMGLIGDASAAPALIAALKAGRMPIYEPGLEELVRRNVQAGRLRFTRSYSEALREADGIAMMARRMPAAGVEQG